MDEEYPQTKYCVVKAEKGGSQKRRVLKTEEGRVQARAGLRLEETDFSKQPQ
jgi:hypothetical protein